MSAPALAQIAGEPLDPCDDCAEEGWPVPLMAGDFRLGLASPDGEFLALIGGSGRPGDNHSVVVLRGGCDGGVLTKAELTRTGSLADPPKEMPMGFVRLAWSPDGRYLFALGTVYRIAPGPGGLFSAYSLRSFEEPFLDFRFSDGRFAAGIAYMKAGEQKTRADGQRGFAVHTEYRLIPMTSPRDSRIPEREPYTQVWVPKETTGKPALSWEEDGWLLTYTPLNKQVDRFKPPSNFETVTDRAPTERVAATESPWNGPCDGTWELKTQGKQVRVRVKGGQ